MRDPETETLLRTGGGGGGALQDPDERRRVASTAPGRGAPAAPSGGGKSLPGDLRIRMEASLGADFADVRVHEGPYVAAIGALAYAQGNELHFAPGRYDPSSPTGQELIGHELTHVVQQRAGRVAADHQAKGAAIAHDAALEAEADQLGARAARGELATVPGAATAGTRASGPAAQGKAAPIQCKGGNGSSSSSEEDDDEDDTRSGRDLLAPDGRGGQVATTNQRMIVEAIGAMPPAVQRFLRSLHVSREQYALLLQLRTPILANILRGLITLPVPIQRQLPVMAMPMLRTLCLELAMRPSAPRMLLPPPDPRTHVKQILNLTTNSWEYFFSYDGHDFPDVEDGSFQNDGYRYRLLRKGHDGVYYARTRSDGRAIQRDFRNERLLSELFEQLVARFGKAIGTTQSDRAAVQQMIERAQGGVAATADRILAFFQGMFLHAYSSAPREDAKLRLEQAWGQFCSFLAGQIRALDRVTFRPIATLHGADPSLVLAYQTAKAQTITPSFGVDVEGQDGGVLVHRSDADLEIIDGVAHVRIYQTVYAPCFTGKFKDIKQLESGKVIIESVGGKSWMNMGWPLRAIHYVKTYAAQGVTKGAEARRKVEQEKEGKYKGNPVGYQAALQEVQLLHGLPIVRTFLVPKDFHDEYTTGSISENQVEQLGSNHTLNVDKAKAPNQYGVRARDVRLFEDHAVPFSLISFVKDGELGRYGDPQHGAVLPLSELARFLHMPLEGNPFVPALKGTHVDSVSVQKQRADELSRLYELTLAIERAKAKPAAESEIQQLVGYWDAIALKYGVSFPADPGQLPALLQAIERAATFALVPHLIEQNYDDMRLRLHNQGVRDSGQRIDPFVELQSLRTVTHPAIKDDEAVPSKVKREDCEARVGETCTSIIEILAGCFRDPDEYFVHGDQVRQVIELMLHLMTADKLCGEDAASSDVLPLLKQALIDRVCGGVKRVYDKIDEAGDSRDKGGGQAPERRALRPGVQTVRALMLGHFMQCVQTAKVPTEVTAQQDTTRLLVVQRTTQLQHVLVGVDGTAGRLGALIHEFAGGNNARILGIQQALPQIVQFVAEPRTLATVADAQAFLDQLLAIDNLCTGKPSYHDFYERSLTPWKNRLTEFVRSATGAKGKGEGADKDSDKKAKGSGSGGSRPRPQMQLTMSPARHPPLLEGENGAQVEQRFTKQARDLGGDLGELEGAFRLGVGDLSEGASSLAEHYQRWLGLRPSSTALQEQFLKELLERLLALYQQFKQLEIERGASSKKTQPFRGALDPTPPGYSPFTGRYDKSRDELRKGTGKLGSTPSTTLPPPSTLPSSQPITAPTSTLQPPSSQTITTSSSTVALHPGAQVRIQYLIGEADVIGVIVGPPNPDGTYRVRMVDAVRPGGLRKYERPPVPNEAATLDYMIGTLFGAIPPSQFRRYEDGGALS